MPLESLGLRSPHDDAGEVSADGDVAGVAAAAYVGFEQGGAGGVGGWTGSWCTSTASTVTVSSALCQTRLGAGGTGKAVRSNRGGVPSTCAVRAAMSSSNGPSIRRTNRAVGPSGATIGSGPASSPCLLHIQRVIVTSGASW